MPSAARWCIVGSMVNLSELALRRLDGAFFDEPTGGVSPRFATRYLLGLLGFTLDLPAGAVFETATDESRKRFIAALESKLTPSLVKRTRTKADGISTASEYGRLMLAVKTTELKLVTLKDLEGLFGRLIEQPLPFSEQDVLDIIELGKLFPVGEFQSTIRENNATLAGLFPDYDWTRSMTVTDALRVAAVFSGGDGTLSTPTRFKLKRSQRRAIALALEKTIEINSYAYFDFARNRETWKRLFTALRVSDYPVPNLQGAAHLLFEGTLVSIDGIIEQLIKDEDFDGLQIHLKAMPGIFARRLHELIRKMPAKREEIMDSFAEVAPRVSTRVLVQLRNYFAGPTQQDAPNLPFAGKSRSARNGFLENRKSGDYSDVLAAVDSALGSKLNGKKIFVSGGDKIAVMTSNRSTALGSRSMAPGSRISVGDDAEFVTLFTHWRNMGEDGYGGRVDLDISALFISEDLQHSEQLAFYNTKSRFARYSGDITDAPTGAEEYISVELKGATRRGFRYMALVVNSYSGQQIGSIPECYSGVAVSESLDFGSFDAAAVEARFDLTAQGREVIPFLFDMETNELIWTDLNFSGARYGATMSGSNSLGSVLKFMVNYEGLTVGQLIELSGATLVDSEDEADLTIDPRMSDQVASLLV